MGSRNNLLSMSVKPLFMLSLKKLGATIAALGVGPSSNIRKENDLAWAMQNPGSTIGLHTGDGHHEIDELHSLHGAGMPLLCNYLSSGVVWLTGSAGL